MSVFHEVLFPTSIGIRSKGGPERRTDIVTLGSGREERNARWQHARRHYNAGYGVRSISALSSVVSFFEERRGRLHGFRFKDRLDFRSNNDGAAPSALDQVIGTGDGLTKYFYLSKTYGSGASAYIRPVVKSVAGTVKIAVAGVIQIEGEQFTVDHALGRVYFPPSQLPTVGQIITAGFEFDVPVRFDTDRLDVDMASFEAGEIPFIPLIEIVP
jgi:uncharacterized protein (TIGR02217 family)